MNAYIFDVDGVLTDPIQKLVTENELLPRLIKILAAGNPIALNTGRSLSWVSERIIEPLEKIISDKSLFKNVIIVGEKGNTLLTYRNGKWENQTVTSKISATLEAHIKKLTESEFSESMFFDPDKTTMISVEMNDGFDNDSYSKQQTILHEKIERLLRKPEYKNLKLRIDPSQISLDIQPQDAGKHLGAVRIEKWLQENNYKPEKVIMFGDSPSDIEMAEELQDRFPCEFVFVNDPAKIDIGNLTCKVTLTKAKFTSGTLEYLTSR